MNFRQYLLLKLSEECSEVAQRASKQIQFGRDETQKNQTETNRERLEGEIRDLQTVIMMLSTLGELDRNAVVPNQQQHQDKIDKIRKYYYYSIELGQI